MYIELPNQCPHDAFQDSHIHSSCTPGFVYIAQVGEIYKIGFTANKLNTRMNGISHEKGVKAFTKIVFRSHCALAMEKALQRVFWAKRVINKIDQTDYFNLSDEDVADIEKITHYGGKELSRECVLSEDERRINEGRIVYFLCPAFHEIKIDMGRPKDRDFNFDLVLLVAARDGINCPECHAIVIPNAFTRESDDRPEASDYRWYKETSDNTTLPK